jgi:hypothetical protein
MSFPRSLSPTPIGEWESPICHSRGNGNPVFQNMDPRLILSPNVYYWGTFGDDMRNDKGGIQDCPTAVDEHDRLIGNEVNTETIKSRR